MDIKDLAHTFTSYALLSPNLSIPIQFSKHFKLEPNIGYFSSEYEEKQQGKDLDYLFSHKESNFAIGIAAFHTIPRNRLFIYYGGHIGVIISSLTTKHRNDSYYDEDKAEGTGFFAAPTLGGECFMADNFSIGGEVQLKYYSLERENTPNREGENNETTAITNFVMRTLLKLRFYF